MAAFALFFTFVELIVALAVRIHLTMSAEQRPEPADEPPRPGHGAEGAADDPRPQPSRQFKPKSERDLEPRVFMKQSGSVMQAVVSDGSVRKSRGDAAFIGEFIRRSAEAIEQLGQSTKRVGENGRALDLSALAFGGSVTAQFVVGEGETLRLQAIGEPTSPSIEAARLVAEMLELEPAELVDWLSRLEPDGVRALRGLLRLIAEDDVRVDWYAHGHEQAPAEIDSKKAAVFYGSIQREGDPSEVPVTGSGRLALADADTNTFGLRLERGGERPPS